MATHSSILDWKIPWTEQSDGLSPWGHKESDMRILLMKEKEPTTDTCNNMDEVSKLLCD